jgi:diaminopimelate decarboxylase
MNHAYQKPSIVKVGNPLYTKHGSSAQSYHFVRDGIEGVSIEELVKKYGSPLFVFSERMMRQKYREAIHSISAHYPNVTLGWSYKTNYLNRICSLFHEEGAYAEVVSQFEYEKARKLGVPGERIIFNGPFKPYGILKQAVLEGAQIHADHFHEIEDLEAIAKELGLSDEKKLKIGIRINLNSGTYPVWSRFGFNLECGQAWAAIRRIAQSKHLRVSGVHCHLGTFILDPGAYTRAAQILSDFIRQTESLVGTNIEYIDLGGGFPSMSHLKGIYQPPEIAVPKVQAYAEALGKELGWLALRNPAPKLYMELGRHLVDEAGFLITSVVADKMLPDGRRSYVLDAGVNLLYTSTWYKFKVELDRETAGTMEPSILNGPLCMNIDIVDEAILLPRLKRFQRLILSPVGAYNVTQWMQFIQYRPAVVLIHEKESSDPNKCEVIRKAENLDDLNRLE